MNMQEVVTDTVVPLVAVPISGFLGAAGVLDALSSMPYMQEFILKNLVWFSVNTAIVALTIGVCLKSYLHTRKISKALAAKTNQHRVDHMDKLWSELEYAVEQLAKEQALKDACVANMMTMASQTPWVAWWIKDAEHRYLYIDKTMLNTMYPGKTQQDLVGKKDSEVKDLPACDYSDLADLLQLKHPSLLPLVDKSLLINTRIVDITDTLTSYYRQPCRFHEEIEGKLYDVWKTPVYEDGKLAGSVGCLVDITHLKEQRLVEIKQKVEDGEAFQIDSTGHYYIYPEGGSLAEGYQGMERRARLCGAGYEGEDRRAGKS